MEFQLDNYGELKNDLNFAKKDNCNLMHLLAVNQTDLFRR